MRFKHIANDFSSDELNVVPSAVGLSGYWCWIADAYGVERVV